MIDWLLGWWINCRRRQKRPGSLDRLPAIRKASELIALFKLLGACRLHFISFSFSPFIFLFFVSIDKSAINKPKRWSGQEPFNKVSICIISCQKFIGTFANILSVQSGNLRGKAVQTHSPHWSVPRWQWRLRSLGCRIRGIPRMNELDGGWLAVVLRFFPLFGN